MVRCEDRELERGFQTPPASARPRVWWHWMNGNITKEGITLDLDWMHRVGDRGIPELRCDVRYAAGGGQAAGVYMTPEWKDAFHFALEKADSMGFEVAVAGSPGWSESGGPWVKPQEAMKKLVWSETVIEGGQAVSRSAGSSADSDGAVRGPGAERPDGADGRRRGSSAAGGFWRGCRRGSVSRAGG